MSSLAATQADGYYVPPEYYESGQYKKKSRNQLAGSKGHNQYLAKGIVRFELPYDGFCTGCGAHVGKGTRFNAQKTKAGNYFTTTIYKFTMRCRICAKSEFVIQTNPKERGFDYLEGIHKQVQEFDTAEAGTAGVIDTEYGNKLVPAGGNSTATTNLDRLESVASGARKTMTERDQLESLIQVNNETFFDDSGSNAAIRATFRADRKQKKRRLHDATALGWRDGMELLRSTTEDEAAARGTCFGNGKKVERETFRSLRTSSIFSSTGKSAPKKQRADGRDEPRPDTVDSLSRSKTVGSLPTVLSPIKQEACTEKKRIRLSTNGAKLVREDIASCSGEQPTPVASSLATLMADYESDSD